MKQLTDYLRVAQYSWEANGSWACVEKSEKF
jgi:hypothetical protein